MSSNKPTSGHKTVCKNTVHINLKENVHQKYILEPQKPNFWWDNGEY